MSGRADDYRQRAEECKAHAAASKHPEQKRQYEEMAQDWLAMARHAERQERSKKEDERS